MTENTTPAAEKIGAIATEIASVQTAVGAFDRINAGLQAIRDAYPADVIVGDIQTTKGMAAAVAARAAWRDPRIAVEKARKDAKAPILALGKAIDGFAQQLTDQLLVGERHYDAQIKAEEERKAAAKAEAARIEAERVEALQKRLDALRNTVAVATGQKAITIAAVLDDVRGLEIDETWAEFTDRAEVAKRLTVMALQNMLATAKATEAEAARLEAERAEQARVAAELEEKRLALAAQAAELERQRAEIAAAEAQRLKDEQDREDARRRALFLEEQAQNAPAPIPMQPVATLGAYTAENSVEAIMPLLKGEDGQISAAAAPVQIISRDAEGFSAVITPAAEYVDPAPMMAAPQLPPAAFEPATLSLGKICERLGFTLTAAFVEKLGVPPRATDKAAKLYSEADFHRICRALIGHLANFSDGS